MSNANTTAGDAFLTYAAWSTADLLGVLPRECQTPHMAHSHTVHLPLGALLT